MTSPFSFSLSLLLRDDALDVDAARVANAEVDDTPLPESGDRRAGRHLNPVDELPLLVDHVIDGEFTSTLPFGSSVYGVP